MNNSLKFPSFDLARLLKTVFAPRPGEKICILIDLPDPEDIREFAFLNNKNLTVQRYAHDIFYKPFRERVLEKLGLKGGEIYAYEMTGGSNLDMPDEARDPMGSRISLKKDIYPNYDIILCISTYSATAPLTASAKKYGFRGATLHGINQTIIDSGLSVNYEDVSRQAERLRAGMTRADHVEVDFVVEGRKETLRIELAGQEAQKSHGLCRGKHPDVANLPAGEIYYVPKSAEGKFPLKFEDGTLGWISVRDGAIKDVALIHGQESVIEEYRRKIQDDPATGILGELGFGTQVLPVSGSDIQDEKILGTFHLATGRSDHLGGDLTPNRFKNKKNATHDDILFAPHKTPEIAVPQVRLSRKGTTRILIENYKPSEYIQSLLQ